MGSQPFGAVIPVTGLNLGIPGTQSRTNAGDAVVAARLANPDNADDIFFGDTVYAIPDATGGTYQTTAEAIADLLVAGVGSIDESIFSGIAYREVKTNIGYPIPPDQPQDASYLPGQMAEAMERGSIVVTMLVGTPFSTGKVYLRTALNASEPAGIVGGLEAQADVTATTTGTASSASTALTVASGTGIVAGQIVAGVGIAPGTFVASITGTAVTLSQNTTAALSTTAVTFSSTILLPKLQWRTGVVDGNSSCEVTMLERVAA